LKSDFPGLEIVVNGGLKSENQIAEQLKHVDGAMIGRQACTDPYWLAGLQRQFVVHGDSGQIMSREALVHRMAEYAAGHVANGGRMHQITRHMLGLYAGVPGAARWRRFLSENARAAEAGPEILLAALACIDAAA
ncbi:MAG TPA: tRNA dihydrouridine(20/20a) synthase DusA, partial [Chromatiales bacterium]|nr:tRNA dihydrouridine(20/20a) synthase DusA [Chromatiales bacterium]